MEITATHGTTARAVAAIALLLTAAPASAQRREGGRVASTWQVTLPAAAQFGGVSLAARAYRLTLGETGFALADPSTMVVMATLPVQESAASSVVPEGTVSVSEVGSELRIVLHQGDRLFTAIGKKGAGEAAAAPNVQLAGRAEAQVVGPSQAEHSDQALVAQALPRYEKSVVDQCADRAHRARWTTDHPQFERCVCPQVLKSRLPKVSGTTRVHRPLAKGKNGYSFTVEKDGKVQACRVWVGVTPPAEPVAAPAPPATPEAKVKKTP